MRFFVISILFFVCISISMHAADETYDLHMKMSITSPDTSIRTLNHICSEGDLIEGYFILPRYKNMRLELPVRAFIQPGGFNILDGKIFGQPVDHMSEVWIKNNFPMDDLGSLTNKIDIAKILSFQIKPVLSDPDSDSIVLLIKYAVFSLIDQKNYELDYDYNIKLFYKKVDVTFNAKSSFDFINDHFEGHDISILFTKDQPGNRILEIENFNNIIDEIVESANESTIHDLDLNLGSELYREKNPEPADPFDDGYLAQFKEHHLPAYNVIVDETTNEEFNLPVSIYKAELTFPFLLYNLTKDEQYKNYRTRDDLFQSSCDVIIVPVSIDADTLTADIYVSYEKLKLDDGFPRWTPIKKRLAINRSYGSRLELPKENWSASFTREGEQYDIYGYSDFEKYVKEWIIINLFRI